MVRYWCDIGLWRLSIISIYTDTLSPLSQTVIVVIVHKISYFTMSNKYIHAEQHPGDGSRPGCRVAFSRRWLPTFYRMNCRYRSIAQTRKQSRARTRRRMNDLTHGHSKRGSVAANHSIAIEEARPLELSPRSSHHPHNFHARGLVPPLSGILSPLSYIPPAFSSPDCAGATALHI